MRVVEEPIADRISQGRFILGLGTGVLSVNMGSYGLPEYKMVAHLRDTVSAVRHIVAGAHKGLEPYNGTYFKADFKELMVTPPPVRSITVRATCRPSPDPRPSSLVVNRGENSRGTSWAAMPAPSMKTAFCISGDA